MRGMMAVEVQKFLDCLTRELSYAGIMSADAICYGGDQKVHDVYKAFDRLVRVIPKDIIDDYNRSINKAKADALRRKADAIERGEEVEK